jgi:hypothetical protein
MISDFRLYLPTGRQGFQVEEFSDLTELFFQFWNRSECKDSLNPIVA